jgi:hypothetical protein
MFSIRIVQRIYTLPTKIAVQDFLVTTYAASQQAPNVVFVQRLCTRGHTNTRTRSLLGPSIPTTKRVLSVLMGPDNQITRTLTVFFLLCQKVQRNLKIVELRYRPTYMPQCMLGCRCTAQRTSIYHQNVQLLHTLMNNLRITLFKSDDARRNSATVN